MGIGQVVLLFRISGMKKSLPLMFLVVLISSCRDGEEDIVVRIHEGNVWLFKQDEFAV